MPLDRHGASATVGEKAERISWASSYAQRRKGQGGGGPEANQWRKRNSLALISAQWTSSQALRLSELL